MPPSPVLLIVVITDHGTHMAVAPQIATGKGAPACRGGTQLASLPVNAPSLVS